MKCRFCQTELEHVFLDLGFAPPSNAYLEQGDLQKPEKFYPLKVMVCGSCWLTQTEDYAKVDELFDAQYAYFSSTSTSWIEHAKLYTDNIVKKLKLSESSYVIEVASNDGYLLKNFLEKNIPCLGIEPTQSTANVAKKIGISVIEDFFSESLGEMLSNQGRQADLIIGNNVYAHVPDIKDFTLGLKKALKKGGVITLEFPHLMRLIEFNQFDTIYHEHFSYLMLNSVKTIFESCDLRVFDVEELPTHGGSLRVYGCHFDDERETYDSVKKILFEEISRGLKDLKVYEEFQIKVNKLKNDFLLFLIQQKNNGKKIAAYGAAAKGCTLLNFAGIKPDLIPFVCDAAPSKQGKFLPGSHIPIMHPEELKKYKPDLVLVLPWNIAKEVINQLDFVEAWGAKFVVAVPKVQLI